MTAASPSPEAHSRLNGLANLDLLRSLAVFLVVGSHLLLYSGRYAWDGWSGLTGVCMFFVHTSLVLMSSLERDPHTARFYLRRIFRLYPLWLIVLGYTVAVHLPTSPAFSPAFGFYKPGFCEFVANALLVSNLFFGCKVVGASWSLPVEAQMYLLLPLLFFFIRATRQLWVLIIIDLFFMLSLRNFPPGQAVTLAVCVPYFLPGVMAYSLSGKIRPFLSAKLFFPYLLVLAALHHRYGTVKVSWFFCLLLGLSLPLFRQVSNRWVRHAAHLIARYSYGLYLCHFTAIAIAVHFMAHQNLALRLLVFVAVLLVLPVTLYHLVEEPMIRLGSRLARRIGSAPEPPVNQRTLSLETVP